MSYAPTTVGVERSSYEQSPSCRTSCRPNSGSSQVLASSGHRVLEAHDARSALERLDAHAGKIDLLLTDIVMPVDDGVALATQLRERYPHIACLSISGYSEPAAQRAAETDACGPLIEEPFTASELLAAVTTALATRHRTQ